MSLPAVIRQPNPLAAREGNQLLSLLWAGFFVLFCFPSSDTQPTAVAAYTEIIGRLNY